MQEIKFGRIEGLYLSQGEPDFRPETRIVREVKLGGETMPSSEKLSATFSLKAQVVDLFAQFDLIKDGRLTCLEIKHGLPFKIEVTQNA